MARIRFTVGIRYLLDGQAFQIKEILLENRFLVENQSFGGITITSQDELTATWLQGRLSFEVASSLAKPKSDQPLATEYIYADFEHISVTQRKEAWRRYQILLPLLQLQPHQRTRAAIKTYAETLQSKDIDTYGKRGPLGTAVGWASIARWLRSFEEAGYDIRALVPAFERSARKGEQRLEPELENIIQAVLSECDKNRMKRTANDVYLMVVNRVAETNKSCPADEKFNLPAPKTIYRRIQTYSPAILRRRNSRLEDQADASVGEGPKPTRVLERVEIDHTPLDVFVVDDEDRLLIGRPNLTFALDVHSGFPFGHFIGFEPPSYQTVANCLLHGILPKRDIQSLYETKNPWPVYGLPETLIVDNGKEFIGGDLRDACAQLGIILEYMPVRTPWFKPSVERFFKTNNTGLVHGVHGTTFSNILDRGDYDAMKNACISYTAFLKIWHIFLLDYYAQKWHTGKNAIPFKRWQESIQGGFVPSLHTNAEETRILLMRSDERVIQRSGIEFEYLYYRSPDLARLRSLLSAENRKVRIKYDPGDISTLYVSDPIQGRWLKIPAADQEYTRGLSLWKHRIINRFVLAEKGEVNIEELAAAKAKIQQIVANEFALTKKNKGRKTAARFLGVSVPPPPSTQPTPPPIPSTSLSTSNVLPPNKTLDTLDLTGWGGDYNLPRSSGDSNE